MNKATTTWCPEREEHGYFIAPLYKCMTNSRAACAHQWCLVDVMARLQGPFGMYFRIKSIIYETNIRPIFQSAFTTKRLEIPITLAYIRPFV